METDPARRVFDDIEIFECIDIAKPCKELNRPRLETGYYKDNWWGYQTWHRKLYAQHYKVNLRHYNIIRHICHNAGCVEIAHLSEGTDADNIMDSVLAGKRAQKLTADQVNSIREEYEWDNVSMRFLAKKYDVSAVTIKEIIHREIWKHLK